jgi:V8-like Glu-specific endopeptidase
MERTPKHLLISLFTLLLLATASYGAEETICGRTDDRTPSANKKVGRLQESGAINGCTATMIGRACAISAGHCQQFFKLEEVQFNVPASRDGQGQQSDKRDIYPVVADSIVNRYGGIGDDYVVFRTTTNPQTGRYAGDAQGHYEVTFDRPRRGQTIRITGYGRDDEPTRSFAQQTHTGKIERMNGATLSHSADTMGGNSGSSIILESSKEIIGIHTHGGCRSNSGTNKGTLIAGSSRLREAIQKCLKWEEDNL